MNQEQILQLVKLRGPIVPSQISKDLGTNILMASAILSEFASRKLVNVSGVKIGGSPLYYVSGQEEKLQMYIDKLQEKERIACELLMEKKILRDSSLEPVSRVALRQCRDFAKPLEVTISGQKEIFWKWYLVPKEQVEPLIKRELELAEHREKPIQVQREQAPIQSAIEPIQPIQNRPLSDSVQAPLLREKPGAEPRTDQVRWERPMTQPVSRIPAAESSKTEIVKSEIIKSEELFEKKRQKISAETGIHKESPRQFQDVIRKFLEMKGIRVIEEQAIKKNSELVYLLRVPNALGELSYYCYAKNKKVCNEADISYALVQGQVRKMPAIFLSSGELTKKAKELLNSSEFSNLTFVRV
ncbi:hypothetical protein HYY72_02300 [Candidatus Woesearchaeota archaeon]|nr:hypothetical protein [Candidatus Woesearchaeota archaeon]